MTRKKRWQLSFTVHTDTVSAYVPYTLLSVLTVNPLNNPIRQILILVSFISIILNLQVRKLKERLNNLPQVTQLKSGLSRAGIWTWAAWPQSLHFQLLFSKGQNNLIFLTLLNCNFLVL